MSSLPSGVRLVRLLNEHLNDIMNRERANQNSIHLYCTGPYWVAFERSAYQLRRTFPDSEVMPMRLLGGDGIRDGSFALCVCKEAHLAKRRYGLQAIDRTRTLPCGLQGVARRRGERVAFIK